MQSIIKRIGLAVFFLTAATVGCAELLRAEDFDTTPAGNIDGRDATGLLSGFWDTEPESTGNCVVESIDGSQVMRCMTTTTGDRRGVALAGIENPIEDTESGTLFFRFMFRSDSEIIKTYMGLHALTGANPLQTSQTQNPWDYITAGFAALDNGSGFDIKTTDGSVTLKAGLMRAQWYDCWIVAHHAVGTFDLYIRPADGPAGAPILPTEEDIVVRAQPFGSSTADPLTGAMWVCPGVNNVDPQTTRMYLDEIWWDGDEGLVLRTKAARNPVPAHRETQVALDSTLSWDTPDDPNVAEVLGYDVYLDPNETDVRVGAPSALVSTGQSLTYYEPPVGFDYDTEYFWRVETTVRMDDPNQTVWTAPGEVWSFTTMTALPVLTQQPVNVIASPGQTAEFSVAVESIKPVSFQWYKSPDRANDTFDDDAAVPGADGPALILSNISAADEGFYYCRVSNPSVAYSEVAGLGVKRELAYWTLNKSDYDAVNELYLDATGGFHAAVAVAGSVPVFVEGATDTVTEGAVAFDPNTRGVVSLLNPSEFTDQMTLSAWVKWDGGPLGEFGNVILQKGQTWETLMWTWKLRQTGDGRAGVRFYNNYGYSAQTDNLIESNVWTHVCATWDGIAGRVYINAALAATDTTGALGPDTLGNLLITGTADDDFPGALDEVRIYNTAFDPVEIAYLYVDVSGMSICLDPDDPILQIYDFNNDCVVNLADVAEMASHWLTCLMVPDCIERP